MFVKDWDVRGHQFSKQHVATRILLQFEFVRSPDSIIILSIPETGMSALRLNL